MAFSEIEKERVLREAFDVNRTSLVCAAHRYSPGGPKPPTAGCQDCWFAFLFHHIAQLPPSKRQERLDELEAVIHAATEADSKGEFDFRPYRHPVVTVEKGSN